VSYDDSYGKVANLFGIEPDGVLVEHYELLDPTLPVLDIGGGQGRNAFFLARRGYAVEVLDPSEVGLQSVAAIAVKDDLPITTHLGGFGSFDTADKTYGGILVFGVIQILSRDGINLLVKLLERWTTPGGLVFLTGHTSLDEGCTERKDEPQVWRPIGQNSFESAAGEVRTYVDPGEVAMLFGGWEHICYVEEIGPEHRHGDGPLQRHHKVEGVFRSSEAGASTKKA